jgi:hypothetical protein
VAEPPNCSICGKAMVALPRKTTQLMLLVWACDKGNNGHPCDSNLAKIAATSS